MDLIELLEEHDVRIWTSGKNVNRGWIGLTCPFCDDSSNHLGINLSTLRCRCWKCGGKSLIRVLTNVCNISSKEAREYVRDFDETEIPPEEDGYESSSQNYIDKIVNGEITLKLPEESLRHFPKLHTNYLISRNFNPHKIIPKYKLRAVGIHGPYKFRIIIPVIKNGRIITFTSRDVTDASELRYKAAPQKYYPNPKHFVYGLDSVPEGGSAVVVEGPTDVWRLGDGSVSFFGTMYHEKQIAELIRKNLTTLHILFDNDDPGIRAARMLAKQCFSIAREINIISIKEMSDPGSLSQEDAYLLMRELKLVKK